ncbi:MAG TPA: integrase, partial [Chloroflexota bacterium]|nr:integrase [Chloroflexota bacterium]
MSSLITALLATLSSVCRSRAALQIEILALRHQLSVLHRSARKRPRLSPADRMLWAWLSRVWSDWRSALVIVKPETVIGWHWNGFRLFLTWKGRLGKAGRPTVAPEIRHLIRCISRENPLWGAPRIHGELLKLGIEIGETSVAKYMERRGTPPSQTWRTFLRNHVGQVVAADFFVVPTVTCRLVFVLVFLAHDGRRIRHVAVTTHPTEAWTTQ